LTLLPANLALTNVAPSAPVLSADHRTNYSAIQAYANALNALFAGGTLGQVLTSGGGTTLNWTPGTNGQWDRKTVASGTTPVIATTEGTASGGCDG